MKKERKKNVKRTINAYYPNISYMTAEHHTDLRQNINRALYSNKNIIIIKQRTKQLHELTATCWKMLIICLFFRSVTHF